MNWALKYSDENYDSASFFLQSLYLLLFRYLYSPFSLHDFLASLFCFSLFISLTVIQAWSTLDLATKLWTSWKEHSTYRNTWRWRLKSSLETEKNLPWDKLDKRQEQDWVLSLARGSMLQFLCKKKTQSVVPVVCLRSVVESNESVWLKNTLEPHMKNKEQETHKLIYLEKSFSALSVLISSLYVYIINPFSLLRFLWKKKTTVKLYKKTNISKTFLELKYNIDFFFSLENVIVIQHTVTITLQYYKLFGTQRISWNVSKVKRKMCEFEVKVMTV